VGKFVYLFQKASNDEAMFGRQGSRLSEMTRAGFPVPPGLIVTTEACKAYYDNNKQFPEGIWEQVVAALAEIEKKVGKRFGDAKNPLLVSVRSGPAFSMPGLMDTVLNLGLNEETVQGLAEQTGDLRFALDVYRRFASLFGEIVIGVAHEKFERVMDRFKAQTKGGRDTDLKPAELRGIIAAEKEIILAEQHAIPDDPYEQLRVAIAAVFNSWMGRRACDYRRLNRIPDNLGTAVSVQAMVFGNMGASSGTGVAFTRNPSTGKKELYGEYLLNAQGEDVVAGTRTPNPITELGKELPKVYEELASIAQLLEQRYRDMQDFEFTLERGRVWLLGSRPAKRTAYAELRVALDLLDEGLITEQQVVLRISPQSLSIRFAPRLRTSGKTPIAIGLPGSSGIAVGVLALTPEKALTLRKLGRQSIFVCYEGAPEYFDAMFESEGVVSLRGGMMGHAAVVCRGMGKPCVTGLARASINHEDGVLSTSMSDVREGELITIDGNTGQIFSGPVELEATTPDEYVQRVETLVWCANASDYLEEGLGLLWQLRDIIRDKGLQQTNPTSTTAYLSPNSEKFLRSENYNSFAQPTASEINNITHAALHWKGDEDTKSIAWSILYELQRQLQNAVGIGNHYLAIRPLNDPERTFVDQQHHSLLPMETLNDDYRGSACQLIGVEFFGISRFLRNLLPWSSLQWWGAVRVDASLLNAWELDRINPNGESLVSRSHDLVAFVVILDGQRLTVKDTRRWYQEFRERELGWAWYKENNLSFRSIVDSLRDIEIGATANDDEIGKLRTIGLVTEENALTSQGVSLLSSETASERKHLPLGGI
jgi:phosphohistidine swiveling domain-containing protein